MLKLLMTRLKQGHRTSRYPFEEPVLSDRYRGRPVVDATQCPEGCGECIQACPTDALARGVLGSDGGDGSGPPLTVDLGRCLFCTDCVEVCPAGAIRHSSDFRIAARSRADLVVTGDARVRAARLESSMLRLFGRSLKLRQVSAGGCNGCEADVNVLGTIVFDLGRFGIQMVASPRHADGLLITGPVTENMKLALEKTYAAVPSPKLVIAVGACAISGGPYVDHPEVHNGAGTTVPIDLYIPGCPPHPFAILDGLLHLLGRIEEGRDLATSWAVRARAAAVEMDQNGEQEEARSSLRHRAEDAARLLGAEPDDEREGREQREER